MKVEDIEEASKEYVGEEALLWVYRNLWRHLWFYSIKPYKICLETSKKRTIFYFPNKPIVIDKYMFSTSIVNNLALSRDYIIGKYMSPEALCLVDSLKVDFNETTL